MKKSAIVIFVLLISTLILSASLVSAASQNLGDLVKSLIDGIIDVAKPFLGALLNETDTSATSDLFMAKLLFAVVLSSLIFVVLGRSMQNLFEERTWALWIVSIGITLIGLRFLPSQFIYTIIIPSSTLAVAVSAGLPFVVYFILVNSFRSKVTRRVAWIFFAVVFLALYVSRMDQLGNVAWIYPFTAALAILMLLLDGTIQKFFADMRLERMGEQRRDDLQRRLARDLQQADQDFADGIINGAEHERLQRRIRRQISGLHR